MSERIHGGARSAIRARALLLLGIVAGCLLSIQERGQGQTFYRWTDENGVVHIADSPPQGADFETEDLPIPAAPAAKAPDSGPAANGADGGAEAGKTPGAAGDEKSSPARVVIEKQAGESRGGAIKNFTGEVKNSGGVEARNVVIEITVTETVQGADCLSEDIPVVPSNLPPGETGAFSVELENPCFHGPTDVQLTPRWD